METVRQAAIRYAQRQVEKHPAPQRPLLHPERSGTAKGWRRMKVDAEQASGFAPAFPDASHQYRLAALAYCLRGATLLAAGPAYSAYIPSVPHSLTEAAALIIGLAAARSMLHAHGEYSAYGNAALYNQRGMEDEAGSKPEAPSP
jgi:hypothetical protein